MLSASFRRLSGLRHGKSFLSSIFCKDNATSTSLLKSPFYIRGCGAVLSPNIFTSCLFSLFQKKAKQSIPLAYVAHVDAIPSAVSWVIWCTPVQIQKFKLHALCMQQPISVGDVGLPQYARWALVKSPSHCQAFTERVKALGSLLDVLWLLI